MAMEGNTLDNFSCPICGTKLLWMPVSHIFVCEGCKETFSENAKFYLHNYDEYIASKKSQSVRNCDVGTAEEQAERFFDFCMGHTVMAGMCDTNCPCAGSKDGCHCVCKWEQLPYEN